MNREVAYQYIPRTDKKVISSSVGGNSLIIDTIHKAVPQATKQTQHLSSTFLRPTQKQTAKAIWHFLKDQINYKADGYEYQDVRLPSHFLRTGTGDCKSYSLFTSAVLSNLGIPHLFRYTSYLNDRTPSHVYIVLSDGTAIDGVYDRFGKEKPYTFKKDYIMQTRTIQGLPNEPILGVKDWARRQINKGKQVVKKVSQGGKTIGLSPARGAFIALLRLNFRGLATTFNEAQGSFRTRIFDKWYSLGGNRTKLQEAINSGRNKKRILGHQNYQIKNCYVPGINGIGEPVTLATLIGSAAAILAAFKPILTELEPYLEKLRQAREKKKQEKNKDSGGSVSTQDGSPIVKVINPGGGIILTKPPTQGGSSTDKRPLTQGGTKASFGGPLGILLAIGLGYAVLKK